MKQDLKPNFELCAGIGTPITTINPDENYQLLTLDMDDVSEASVYSAVEYECPEGVYAILKNGENSYNVISLSIHPMREVIQTKANVPKDDAQHLKLGIKRGYWIIRLSGKHERDRPELIDIVSTTTEAVISEKHLKLFEALYPKMDVYSLMPAVKSTINCPIMKTVYPTRCKD